jgi:hypothetical protein
MRRTIVSLAVFMLAAVMTVWGQSQPKTVARVYTIKVKPGEGQQWEAGVKRYLAWEHQHNVPVNTYAWEVVDGPNEGEYVIGQFGHAWKDFDAMQEQGAKAGVGKEIQATVAPYTESVETSYYNFRPDLSIHPPDPNKPPTALSSVTFFTLKPGGMGPVVSAIKQADEAIKKSHWGGDTTGGWYELVNGGEGPQIVLSNGLENMAGMQPPSPSLGAMLASVYGKQKADGLMRSFDAQIRYIRTELIAYRPDLSYIAQTH